MIGLSYSCNQNFHLSHSLLTFPFTLALLWSLKALNAFQSSGVYIFSSTSHESFPQSFTKHASTCSPYLCINVLPSKTFSKHTTFIISYSFILNSIYRKLKLSTVCMRVWLQRYVYADHTHFWLLAIFLSTVLIFLL